MYPQVQLHIDGVWRAGAENKSETVLNPATGAVIGEVPHASRSDLDAALTPFARRRHRQDYDPGAGQTSCRSPRAKPSSQPISSIGLRRNCARTYGQIVAARASNVVQLVTKEPVGPVAAFTPWNFPINQAVRKISAAIAAGCSVILKGPEETPASCMELVRAYADAGAPGGVLNLVFGVPAEISNYLIPHPTIRKISFTGSTAVGKHLAALAGKHMKRATMELGGHAPAIVFEDADLDSAVRFLSTNKFRNAGQFAWRRRASSFTRAFTSPLSKNLSKQPRR